MRQKARSELSNLEFPAVQPKNPDAPLSDIECHLQGFQNMGACGEHKVFQFIRSLLHPALLWACSLRTSWAGFSKPVYPSHSSKATSSTKLLTTFPWGIITQLPLWTCLGEQMGSLLGAENPIFFTFLSPSYWCSFKVLNEKLCSRSMFLNFFFH